MSEHEPMLGPVDFLVIGYPAGAPRTGEAIPLFLDLVERGIITVLDVTAIEKLADGTIAGFSIADVDGDGHPDLIAFAGASSGLIGEEDLSVAGEGLQPGDAAVLIVFENTWAAPFATAVRRNGGEVLAFERVSPIDLLDAINTLESAGTAG
ncbi:unannotated protein [freshwater metagenome]|uniref:Unannotated protein n=1 Tax=freshwater metagenome TaxID=449393 RepID=A0A6J7DHR2_9ZZZZ|nr:DUF1269 domain-containing protein [Actinomycetota bacterium]